MTITERLRAEFEQEMRTTRRLLERLPTGDWGWKPHPKSMTLGELASHLSHSPGWASAVLGQDSFDAASVSPAAPAESLNQVLESFDRNVQAALEALERVQEDDWDKPWSFRVGAEVKFTLPRYTVFRNFVLNHIVHHRGQLSVYLRLRDVAVPSIYGPSADENGG